MPVWRMKPTSWSICSLDCWYKESAAAFQDQSFPGRAERSPRYGQILDNVYPVCGVIHADVSERVEVKAWPGVTVGTDRPKAFSPILFLMSTNTPRWCCADVLIYILVSTLRWDARGRECGVARGQTRLGESSPFCTRAAATSYSIQCRRSH
jgi:hypothetical protein